MNKYTSGIYSGALLFAVSWTFFFDGISAVEARQRPQIGDDIVQGVYAEDRAWLLSDAGTIRTLDLSTHRLASESLPNPTSNICNLDGRIVAITSSRPKPTEWTIYRRLQGAWDQGDKIPSNGDRLVGLICESHTVSVLTDQRLLTVGAAAKNTINLTGTVGYGRAYFLADGQFIYVGYNAGEFGGGLQKIEEATGKIINIDTGTMDSLCGGGLSMKCDAVNGLISSPFHSNCIIAAVGVAHFIPTGRLVEVCGTKVTIIYSKATDAKWLGKPDKNDGGLHAEIPFIGVERQQDSILGVGTDGIYLLQSSGSVTFTPMPKFRNWGGLKLNSDLPRVLLVMSSDNQHHAMGGNLPMLISRSGG